MFLSIHYKLIIYLGGLGPNTHAFRVPPNFSKPIIQSYFEQLYGVEIININTSNKDPVDKKVGTLNRRKRGYKKAWITFAKPFEMNWNPLYEQPHLLYHNHTKYLIKRGHAKRGGTNNPIQNKPTDVKSTAK